MIGSQARRGCVFKCGASCIEKNKEGGRAGAGKDEAHVSQDFLTEGSKRKVSHERKSEEMCRRKNGP